MAARAHVFGYGSLVAGVGPLVRLRGHRRVWGVAMDNAVAVPGYKVYEAPDGSRPALAVAFLDLEPHAGGAVDGALIEVDVEALAVLDRRERQYRRIEVTGAVDPAPGGRVFAFAGHEESRARAAAGRTGEAEVVIQRAYAELVDRAFAGHGPDVHARYRASTEPPPFPLRDLARVDLPPRA